MSTLMDKIKKKRQDIAAKTGRTRAEKPPVGKSRWRILPSWKGEEEVFFRDFGQHFIKRIDETGTEKVLAVYTCDAVTHGTACEVCEHITRAKVEATDDVMVNMLDKSKAKGDCLMSAVRTDGSGDKSTPVVLSLTPTTLDQVLAIMEEHGAAMLDPESGVDVIIERKGAGLDTKYNVQAAAKSPALDKSLLDKLVDLDAFVADTEENRLKALTSITVVSGVAALPSTARVASAKALASPAKAAPAAAVTVEEEEIEDLEEIIEEIDEEDEFATAAPAKPAAKPAAKAAPAKAAAKATPAKAPVELAGAPSDDDLEAMLADLA
jgi:hypothetical protein